jgi:hypothetical protein
MKVNGFLHELRDGLHRMEALRAAPDDKPQSAAL